MVDQAMVARLFDADWYLAMYPDVIGQEPLEHFRRTGAAEVKLMGARRHEDGPPSPLEEGHRHPARG